MIIKNKKLLALGAMTLSLTPVIAVVSCGEHKGNNAQGKSAPEVKKIDVPVETFDVSKAQKAAKDALPKMSDVTPLPSDANQESREAHDLIDTLLQKAFDEIDASTTQEEIDAVKNDYLGRINAQIEKYNNLVLDASAGRAPINDAERALLEQAKDKAKAELNKFVDEINAPEQTNAPAMSAYNKLKADRDHLIERINTSNTRVEVKSSLDYGLSTLRIDKSQLDEAKRPVVADPRNSVAATDAEKTSAIGELPTAPQRGTEAAGDVTVQSLYDAINTAINTAKAAINAATSHGDLQQVLADQKAKVQKAIDDFNAGIITYVKNKALETIRALIPSSAGSQAANVITAYNALSQVTQFAQVMMDSVSGLDRVKAEADKWIESAKAKKAAYDEALAHPDPVTSTVTGSASQLDSSIQHAKNKIPPMLPGVPPFLAPQVVKDAYDAIQKEIDRVVADLGTATTEDELNTKLTAGRNSVQAKIDEYEKIKTANPVS